MLLGVAAVTYWVFAPGHGFSSQTLVVVVFLGWLSLSVLVGAVGAACRTPLFSLVGAVTLIIVPIAVELSFYGPGGYSAGVMCFVVPLVVVSYLVTRYIVRRHRYPEGCCASCGYDLRGAAGDRCSECGAPISADERQ
ncbi:MAG: hypothetical protein AMXMBFR47_03140 [Planctomycetota bacterium]